MSTIEQVPDVEQVRADWLAAVDRLLEDIIKWSSEQGWPVRVQDKEIQEKLLGSYHVRQVEVDTPEGVIVAEPVAQSVVRAHGRVDLYAWATRHKVRLLRQGHEWIVRTDSGIDWPSVWGRDTYVYLAQALARAR